MRRSILLLVFFIGVRGLGFAQDPSLHTQQLLYKLRTEENAQQEIDFLAGLSAESLQAHLSTDAKRLAFWINIYNAFIIIKIRENPKLYEQKRTRFFTQKGFTVAQNTLSFDDVEHGILRRSKHKFSRGAFGKPFYRISKFEKMFRVDSLDYRLHFALNCGAVSCPPIAFYEADKIHEQLEQAKSNFLNTDSKYNEATNTLYVSRIFYWFLRDFGGRRGIIEMHKDLKVVPRYVLPLVRYKIYNWERVY